MPKRRRRNDVLDRILATPHLALTVPRLQPEVLHRVIQHCGLEDCGQLIALATPDQLARVFDLDLWRPAAPGLDEQFDAGRFGTWLDVMIDIDVSSAAATLAAMDVDLVAAGFVQHVRVFDHAAVAPFITLDGEVAPGAAFADGLRCEVGGFVVVARRGDFWNAITTVLNELADAHGRYLNEVMRACCRQSDSRPEVDGLNDLLPTDEQTTLDLALDRDTRRDTQGYVTPAQARAFLQASRRIDLRNRVMPSRDPITRAYLRDVDHEPVRDTPVEAVASLVDFLHEAGVMPRAHRALLEGPHTDAPRLARIRAHLQFVHDRDPDAYIRRNAELAYLGNVIAAGSSIQSRLMSAEEASNAAVAVCNLGLENWPVQWPTGEKVAGDFLIHNDLVCVFQVGWTVLHEDVCMYAAEALISVVDSVHCSDSDVQTALDRLRLTLRKYWRAGSPWDARGALDVIAILDAPSWAALLGFIDQLPTLHGAVGALLSGTTHRIDASAFEFISENAQIQQVRAFLQRLPEIFGN